MEADNLFFETATRYIGWLDNYTITVYYGSADRNVVWNYSLQKS